MIDGGYWWTSWPSAAAVAVAAVALAVALAVAYRYATSTYGYWRDRDVPWARSPVPLFGHLFGLITGAEQQMSLYRRLYRLFDGHAYGGFYQMRTPYLMVRDPELINRLLIRDFGHFTDHGLYTSGPRENPLGNGLFNMKGVQWKTMRTKLSPAFTTGKLRNMRPEMAECGERLLRDMADALRTGDGTMEVRDKLGDYSTEVIGACAFGLRLNAIDDRQSEFRRYGREVLRPTALFLVRELTWMVSPALRRMIRVNDFPPDAIRFFTDAFGDTVDRRTRSGVVRDDLVQTLIQARTDLVVNKTVPDVTFEETDIVANAFVMFVAGFETVSTALSFCLYELALKKHIQDRVRNEIIAKKAKHGNETKSEFLMDLPYMEMVLAETLRKYPPLLMLFREATQDYHVPDDKLVIEKGTKIAIPINAIHYDHRYYPDPETFDPERFSTEEKAKRPSCTYLPFGDGPRICIGKRFAEMEMKLALTEILSKYEVEPCAKTDIPMKFSAQSLLVVPENGIWLRFISVQKSSSVQ